MRNLRVTLITGRHITAADKRAILDGIEYLREQFAPYVAAEPHQTPAYASMAIRRDGSPKRYTIAPEGPQGHYAVTIRSNETDSAGRPMTRQAKLAVKVSNVAPLYVAPQQHFHIVLAGAFPPVWICDLLDEGSAHAAAAALNAWAPASEQGEGYEVRLDRSETVNFLDVMTSTARNARFDVINKALQSGQLSLAL